MNLFPAALILFALALPAGASTRVTVAQLGQIVAAGRTQTDSKVADEISALELTQRLDTSALAHLQSQLPGPQSKQELSILAAQSSFLSLPPTGILPTPAPSLDKQRQIMALVVDYVTKTILKLPNFTARRETRAFEDRPSGQFSYLPLHPTSSGVASVVYRDGHEVDKSSHGKNVDTATGLVSWGEFGPVLSTVLLDAAQNHLSWSHWEQGDSGAAAVFAYSVAGDKSHYQIRFCCTSDSVYASTGSSGAPGDSLYRKFVSYHGEITVNPATGAILRITVIADLAPADPLLSASIAVRYGSVEIAGRSYICPVRAEALAVQKEQPQILDPSGTPRKASVITRLNEITFDNYHVYRGETRILVAGAGSSEGDDAKTPPAGSSAAGAPSDFQPYDAANWPTEAPAATSSPSASSLAAPQPATAADVANVPVFRTNARDVLVDVIVSKKNGDPIQGLTRQEFTVSEDGKAQTIDFFEEHALGVSPQPPPVMPHLPPGAATNVPATPQTSALYVLLLDSLNTEPQDQVFTNQQVLSFLGNMQPGTQVAVFALGLRLRLLQSFTTDSKLLLAAVSAKSAEREAMAQNHSDNEEDASDIANLQMMQAGGAGMAAMRAAMANTHAYSFASRAAMTFEAMNAIARYLEGIPGRKNLIWFASSFPVAFFPTPRQLKQNSNLPGYMSNVKQTANLFTISQIAVYPVSAAGLPSPDISFGGRANPIAPVTAAAMEDATAFASMDQLAESTGGRAFRSNDIDQTLRNIVRDSEDYYTIGYSPGDSAMDGAFHRIAVKVSGEKYKLAYRQGYIASEADPTPAENPMATLLQFGIPNATGIFYGAKVARASQGSSVKAGDEQPAGQNPQLKGPTTRYTVSFTIRGQDVSFRQAPNGARVAKLVVGVKAYGANGAALNWQVEREAAELTAAQYASILKTGLPIDLDLDLPANTRAGVVTAVYDWNTTRSGTLELLLQP